MISHDSLMNMIFTEAVDGPAEECVDRMSTSELNESSQENAVNRGVTRTLHASMKMEHFFLKNYGSFPTGCLDHRTREEIARSKLESLDTSNWVTIGRIHTHPKTGKEYFVRATQPAKPKPHKIRWGYEERFDSASGRVMRFYTK